MDSHVGCNAAYHSSVGVSQAIRARRQRRGYVWSKDSRCWLGPVGSLHHGEVKDEGAMNVEAGGRSSHDFGRHATRDKGKWHEQDGVMDLT
jgi:hypothetical protein